jgi:anti-sigma-K factor RskA
MLNDHVRDDLPAYVLGSLEAGERLIVEQHLERCLECQTELRQYEGVAGLMGLATHQHTPPQAVKNMILQQVTKSHSSVQKKAWLRGWMENLPRWVIPAWSVASLALIICLGVVSILQGQQINTLQQQQRSTAFQTVALVSPEVPAASGILVISMDGASGALVVDGLAVLDSAKQYQLWLIRDGERTSGGVFSVTADGYGVLQVEAPLPLVSYQSFGITVEPAGGSPGPTGKKVLGGGL